jgi:type IV pilus assembly protein PilA
MKSMKSIKAQAQAGFTLIELMIVVAIIGILAAVAIPAYQNYTIKAKMGSAMSSVESIKTGIALCIQEQGGNAAGCSTNGDVPAFSPTKEVTSATVDATSAAITLTLRNIGSGVDTGTIVMTPTVGADKVMWTYTSTGITNTAATDLIAKYSGS